MRIGIISEGHADRAVISNIIVGLTGMDESDIVALRPIYCRDETDKAAEAVKISKSSFTVIKKECEKKDLIDGFLAIEGHEFVTIHIDTAEADKFGVQRPNSKSDEFCSAFRDLVKLKINEWLGNDMEEQILYAIAIEEIEAWILTLHEDRDSSKSIDAKKRFDRILGKMGITTTSNYENFLGLSNFLKKQKKIETYLSRNCSLAAFHTEIKDKVLPLLNK